LYSDGVVSGIFDSNLSLSGVQKSLSWQVRERRSECSRECSVSVRVRVSVWVGGHYRRQAEQHWRRQAEHYRRQASSIRAGRLSTIAGRQASLRATRLASPHPLPPPARSQMLGDAAFGAFAAPPQILYPQSSTLRNPQPPSLNPRPATLAPQPSTLNPPPPQPPAQNPQPPQDLAKPDVGDAAFVAHHKQVVVEEAAGHEAAAAAAAEKAAEEEATQQQEQRQHRTVRMSRSRQLFTQDLRLPTLGPRVRLVGAWILFPL